MLRLEVDADDLLHTRFALSPLFELDLMLRVLNGMAGLRLPPAWNARIRPVYVILRRETDLDALLVLLRPKEGAAFIAPPPRSLAQTVEDDLAAVRAASQRDARKEIEHYLDLAPKASDRVRKVPRSKNAVGRLADTMEVAWREQPRRERGPQHQAEPDGGHCCVVVVEREQHFFFLLCCFFVFVFLVFF